MDETKILTVLKKTENGKLKSMLVFNSANEQARLYFSDDEKLSRIVVGNGSRNLVAVDRVGIRCVTDPLTPGCTGDFKDGKDIFWYNPSRLSSVCTLFMKDSSGAWGEYVVPKTENEEKQMRCFMAVTEGSVIFQNTEGEDTLRVALTPEGKVAYLDTHMQEACEIFEENTTTNAPEDKLGVSLIQREIEKRRTR